MKNTCEITPHHRKIWYAPNMFEAYGEDEIKAVTECLKTGWLAPGPITTQFEKEIASIFGKKFGVMVNSGSAGNMLALLIAGLKSGDEVITPACTFATTVAPIVQLGMIPVFCDVEIGTYVPSVEQVLEKITPHTKAFFLPNLIGSKVDWVRLKSEIVRMCREDIVLIEDSCDTITHTLVTDISVTSFYASHVITAGGGGGIVMCNKQSQRDLALQYRDWGRIGNNTEDFSERFGHKIDDIEYDFKFLYTVMGYNFKSTEMNAAFGLAQIKKLPAFQEKRRKNINLFVELLKDLEKYGLILPKNHDQMDWLALPLMYSERKKLLQTLEEHNIQTRVCFAGNITRHPAYRKYLHEFPMADKIMRDGFLLGAHHGIELQDVEYVCSVIKNFVLNNRSLSETKNDEFLKSQ